MRAEFLASHSSVSVANLAYCSVELSLLEAEVDVGLGAGWKGSAAAAASSSAVVCMRLKQCALYVASFLRAMCSTVVGR